MGGAEYQTMLISEGLAALGHKVVFLATSSASNDEFDANGLAVRRLPGWRKSGWRRHRQDIDEFIRRDGYHMCYVRAFPELGTIAPLSKRAGVPLVSASSGLRETSPFLLGNDPLETIAYLRSLKTVLHLRSFLSIRSSAVHVCNTLSLLRHVRRWYHKKPMRMIYNGSPEPSPAETKRAVSSGQAIWVNNIKPLKRPEVYIQLARRLPQFHFVMIGQMSGSRIYSRRLEALIGQAPPNFHYLGAMPIDRVNAMIEQSDLLIGTSLPVEGFPNSYIQAWLRGVPTVSYSYELDGIVEREGVGRCPSDFAQLVVDVRDLMSDEVARREMGHRAREYAIRHHNIESMVSDYAALFKQVVDEF